FLIKIEGASDLLFPERSLIVIEIIETPNFERAIVRAITGADTAVVGHDVQPVLAVKGCVDWANRLAGSVFAVLTHHRLAHQLAAFDAEMILRDRQRIFSPNFFDGDAGDRFAVSNDVMRITCGA